MHLLKKQLADDFLKCIIILYLIKSYLKHGAPLFLHASLCFHLFLTYTRVYSLGALLTLHTVLIISGRRPIHTIINFILCWNWAGHCLTVPHFWWKMGIHIAGHQGESTYSTIQLLIPQPIAYVRLHETRWPGVNLVAAVLFPFCLRPIPIRQCVFSLSLNLQKKSHIQ